jgi:hypothetical protein
MECWNDGMMATECRSSRVGKCRGLIIIPLFPYPLSIFPSISPPFRIGPKSNIHRALLQDISEVPKALTCFDALVTPSLNELVLQSRI